MVNMAFSVLPNVTDGGLHICVHSRGAPSEQEWDVYFGDLVTRDPERLRTLVFTDGGALSAVQRKQVNDFLQGRTSRAAVLTKSPIVRGVVSALSWFNPKIKTFSPGNMDDAMRHLGIPASDFPQVRGELKILRQRFGQTTVESLAGAL
jgi:hypothetical protein